MSIDGWSHRFFFFLCFGNVKRQRDFQRASDTRFSDPLVFPFRKLTFEPLETIMTSGVWCSSLSWYNDSLESLVMSSFSMVAAVICGLPQAVRNILESGTSQCWRSLE